MQTVNVARKTKPSGLGIKPVRQGSISSRTLGAKEMALRQGLGDQSIQRNIYQYSGPKGGKARLILINGAGGNLLYPGVAASKNNKTVANSNFSLNSQQSSSQQQRSPKQQVKRTVVTTIHGSPGPRSGIFKQNSDIFDWHTQHNA